MKKFFSLFAILVAISLTGCTEGPASENSASNVDSSMQDSSNSGAPKYDKVDIDFTKWDTTLVQSNYYSMESYPSNYTNKIVKVKGPFMPYDSDDPNLCYPAIYLFNDSTGCCAYCFEFLLYGVPICSPKGGNGYPLLNEEATIVGRFDKYIENGSVYIHLVDAIWVK